MKKLIYILILIIAVGAFADDRDIFPSSDRVIFKPNTQNIPTGGASDGSLLYWDTTTAAWLVSDVTKLKWDDSTDILLVDTLNLTNPLDISDYTNLAVTTPITLTDDSVGMVNQGTTTTVLHGNAAGNPTFSTVDISADTSLTVSAPVTLTDDDIGWNSTLIDATTWSDGANASNQWTFDVSGTDHTMTAGDGIMTFSNDLSVTGNVGIGVAPSANTQLDIEMAASDTMGINIDGDTNPFIYTGAFTGQNFFTRTINDSGSPGIPISSFVNTFITTWNADLSGTGVNWNGQAIDSINSSFLISSDLASIGAGWGGGAAIRTTTFNAAKFLTDLIGTLTTNAAASSKTWNPQFIAFNAETSFRPSAITSTKGLALYQAIGGKFVGKGTLPANIGGTDTQTMEFIGGLFSGEGQTNPGNLPTTSIGLKVSAIDSDTNIAIQVLAGSSRLLDTQIGNPGTTHLEVEADGDTFWVGAGTGLLYGNMDQDGGTFEVFLEFKDQLYELDADTTHISAGPLNDVTFPGDHFLKGNTAGDYFVVYSLVAQIDNLTGGSEHIEFEILKNGTAMSKGETHIDFKNTVREFPLGSTTIITLADGDEISLGAVAVDSSGKTITIDHLEMSIFMVGGT